MKKLKKTIFTLSFILSIASCGGNIERSTDTSTSVSQPTSTVAQNLAALNQQLIEDSENKSNEISGNLSDYLDELDPGADTRETSPRLKKFLQVSADPDGEIQGDIEIDEQETCDDGGTKTYAGTLAMDAESGAGTLSGTYTVVYNACIEFVILQAGSGSCVVELQIDGTFSHDININFSNVGSESRDVSISGEEYQTSVTVTNASGTQFVVDGGSTQNATFAYDYYLTSITSTDNLDGTITYNTFSYDMDAMRDYVTDNTSTDVCP